MKIEDFVLIKKYNQVKLRKYLISRYEPLVKHLAKIIIKKYYSIPITWEDIYVESLFKLPEIFASFDPEKNDNIDLYLSTRLIYFMKNACRKWLSKKLGVLNKAVEFSERHQTDENDANEPLYNTTWRSGWLDKYTDEEKKIIHFLLDSNKTLKEIAQLTGLSKYKLHVIVNNIKRKLRK